MCNSLSSRVKPVHTIVKRNASIHTRNILIQKAKLEHVDNFGIILLVSENKHMRYRIIITMFKTYTVLFYVSIAV